MAGYTHFQTEDWFARHEFTARHLLAASDCESISIDELLEMSGGSLAELGSVSLAYTEPQGAGSLRQAIADGYDRVDPDDVVILGSPIEGIYLTMRTLLSRGDEVIVLAPCYDALRNLPSDITGNAHLWQMVERDGHWTLDMDALRSLLSDRTRLVVLNFPHNPTGYLPTHDEFSELVKLVEQSGAWLYHDEIFRGLEHGDRPRLASAADLSARTLVLGGLSKTHGLPGLRAGWLVVRDAELRAEVINTKMYTSICSPAPIEYLMAQALSVAEELAARSRAVILENLVVAEDFFSRHGEMFSFRRPLAGPVGLVRVDVDSAADYCDTLVADAGVMLLPSSSLGMADSHVRFGFGRRSFPEHLTALDKYLESVAV